MKLFELIVIIPILFKNELIKYTLKSLNEQKLKNFVLVISDASNNGELENYIKSNKFNYKIDYRKSNQKGISSIKNESIKYCLKEYKDLEYFVFINDECILDKNVLYDINRIFKTNYYINHINIKAKNENNIFLNEFLNASCFNFDYGISKNFCAYRRSIFDRYNLYFPPLFETYNINSFFDNTALSYCVSRLLKSKIVNIETSFIKYYPKYYYLERDYFIFYYFNNRLLFDYFNRDETLIKRIKNSIKFEYNFFYKHLIFLLKNRKYKLFFNFYRNMKSIRKNAKLNKNKELFNG